MDKSSSVTKDTIEVLSKLGAFIVVCLYLTGFLAINQYLYHLGVSDFSLIQARFIYTGLLALLFIAVTFALLSLGYRIVKRSKTNLPEKLVKSRFHYISRIIAGCFLLILPWLIFAYFVNSSHFTPPRLALGTFIRSGILRGDILNLKDLLISISFYLLSVAIFFIIFFVTQLGLGLSNDDKKADLPTVSKAALLIASSAIAIMLLNLYLGLFVEYIYPQIPEQFGGGQPKLVMLLVDKTNVDSAKQLGIKFSADGNLSEPLLLLFDGSDSYVFSIPSDDYEKYPGEIVEIEKKVIQGIRIIEPRGGGL